MLTVNTTKSLHITAKDSDDDAITFDVTGLPKGGIITSNGSMVSVTWKVTMEKVYVPISILEIYFESEACVDAFVNEINQHLEHILLCYLISLI